jgi:hypothetical protein
LKPKLVLSACISDFLRENRETRRDEIVSPPHLLDVLEDGSVLRLPGISDPKRFGKRYQELGRKKPFIRIILF